jgi:hypothetical protein
MAKILEDMIFLGVCDYHGTAHAQSAKGGSTYLSVGSFLTIRAPPSAKRRT